MSDITVKEGELVVRMIRDHYDVGDRRHVHKETERLLNVVTRVPATTGAKLRRLLQVRAVRHVQRQLGNYFNNNLVLFLSGVANYDMALAMSDYTPNLKFADAVLQTGAPAMLTSLQQLELYAQGAPVQDEARPRLQGDGQVARDRRDVRGHRHLRHRRQPRRQDADHLGDRRRAARVLRGLQRQPRRGRLAQAVRQGISVSIRR